MSRISYVNQMEEWEQEFSFSIPINVRFSETDMFGHLNNTVMFVYFEEARIEYFKHMEFMQEWVKMSVEMMPVVADLQCDYIRQVYFGESLRLYVKSARVGTSSVDLHYMAKNEQGKICFVGRGTMVNVSKKTGKSMSWPEEWKERLESK
ncbi:acyl-CoA thioesterase [Priestia taiwanensis]|uniref:4-hydroxybenzoyl-CoA thioesterase n=1 Tax=Priestia taiwanensis TaxID=1347902 RepID=A0A917AUD9_9BACI|nr:thioesterase family protein [Priestia taiwanensis]MBM7363535.1 acyl-CoA thioester hydrolase [Priestia taiwanensis]GGE76322.1 4-hydroxybenzoyl-CoA thioesterase [Priestia taiwanensis]